MSGNSALQRRRQRRWWWWWWCCCINCHALTTRRYFFSTMIMLLDAFSPILFRSIILRWSQHTCRRMYARVCVCVSVCVFFSSLLFLHFVMFIPSIAYCFILPNFWEMRIISICTDMCMRIEAPLLFSVPNIRNGYNNTIVQCISIYCIYSYPFSILFFFFFLQKCNSACAYIYSYIHSELFLLVCVAAAGRMAAIDAIDVPDTAAFDGPLINIYARMEYHVHSQ